MKKDLIDRNELVNARWDTSDDGGAAVSVVSLEDIHAAPSLGLVSDGSIPVILTRDEIKNIKEALDVMGDRLADREGYSSGEAYWDLKEKLEAYSDMSYDKALAPALNEAAKGNPLSVNRVTLIRERWSEREIWADDFWVDAAQTPSKELFQKAVEAFLMTNDGQAAVDQTCNDFNWGDAVIYVPHEIWNKYGIYPFDYSLTPEDRGLAPTSSANLAKIQVDQDEVLIPIDYFDRLEALSEKKPSLKDRIQSASSHTSGYVSKVQTKAREPEM